MIYSQNSNSKDQKKHKRRCYRCKKKDHEIKDYLYTSISHRSFQIYNAYPINYVDIKYESVLNNLENYNIKKLEYIENNNSNKNKYRKIFLQYQEIITKNSIILNNYLINIHFYKKSEIKKKELAITFLVAYEIVQERSITIPANQQHNCSQEWNILQY